MTGLLERLRAAEPSTVDAVDAVATVDVRLVADGPLGEVFQRAIRELTESCVRPLDGSPPVLHEGGVYRGTWLESTGTISAELLSRFLPEVAGSTLRLFADRQRDDGLLPYKVTDAGPSYRQIQMVTPLARSVYHHHRLTGADPSFLRTMYDAMARHDAWLARYRDTRDTGAVEAFCTFDTGHDNSPRFWHVPDTTPDGDPPGTRAMRPPCPTSPPT